MRALPYSRIRRIADDWGYAAKPQETLARILSDTGGNAPKRPIVEMLQALSARSHYRAVAIASLQEADGLLESEFLGPCVAVCLNVSENVIWNVLLEPLVEIGLIRDTDAHALIRTLLYEAGPRHDDSVRRVQRFFGVPSDRIQGRRASAWRFATSHLPIIADAYACRGIAPKVDEAASAIEASRWLLDWAETYPANLKTRRSIPSRRGS